MRGEMAEHGEPDAAAAEIRLHEDIFEVHAGPPGEGAEGVVPKRNADRTRRRSPPASLRRAGAAPNRARAKSASVAVTSVEHLLVFGEAADQAMDFRDVGSVASRRVKCKSVMTGASQRHGRLGMTTSQHQAQRVFDDRLERRQPFRTERAVDHAVIDRRVQVITVAIASARPSPPAAAARRRRPGWRPAAD